MRIVFSLCLLLSSASCGGGDPGPPTIRFQIDVSAVVEPNIDILFVIDNSGSMNEEQISLVNSFPALVNGLASIEGGMPNVHLGVVSSDVGIGGEAVGGCSSNDGDNGLLQNTARTPPCPVPTDTWISDLKDPYSPGGRLTNYPSSATLAGTFSCIAKLGTRGCGFEQHFEAMKRALDGRNPQNTGFLRADALLAVIFVADEDDCSASDSQVFDATQTSLNDPLGPLSSFRCYEFGVDCDGGDISRSAAAYSSCAPKTDSMYIWDPRHYVDFLRDLKPDHFEHIIVAAIVGEAAPFSVSLDPNTGFPYADPACQTANGRAHPGVRFDWFRSQFPDRNTFTSICNTNLSDALTAFGESIAQVFDSALTRACVPGNIDTTDLWPGLPGLQLDCQVSEFYHYEIPVRRCDMLDEQTPFPQQPHPCWYAKQDFVACQTASGLVFHIAGALPSNGSSRYVAQCVIQG